MPKIGTGQEISTTAPSRAALAKIIERGRIFAQDYDTAPDAAAQDRFVAQLESFASELNPPKLLFASAAAAATLRAHPDASQAERLRRAQARADRNYLTVTTLNNLRSEVRAQAEILKKS